MLFLFIFLKLGLIGDAHIAYEKLIDEAPLFISKLNIPKEDSFLATALLYNQVALQQIALHPFNRQLFNGTLPTQVFEYYLVNDYWYLHHMAPLLLELSFKMRTSYPTLAKNLNHLAKDIIAGELTMQQQYQKPLAHLKLFKPGPAISSYINYLNHIIKNPHTDLSVQLSAILPCFWIYKELGVTNTKTSERYELWINTYSDSDFIETTQHLAQIINTMASRTNPLVQEEMQEAFSQSVHYELDFFNETFEKNSLPPTQ